MLCLIYTHSPSGTAWPQASCVYIRLSTLACVTTYAYIYIYIYNKSMLLTHCNHAYNHNYTYTRCNVKVNKLVSYNTCFGWWKPWWIWWITGGKPTFTIHILTISCDIDKEIKKHEFTKILIAKSFRWEICQSFLLPNLCTILYMIQNFHWKGVEIDQWGKETMSNSLLFWNDIAT